MMPMGIPAWTAEGILPPINEASPTSVHRSPYVVRLSEVVERFGSTSERLHILDGLLQYRAALHAVGLVRGLQWLDGSFLENVEQFEGRPPNDIDVVTFYRLQPGTDQSSVAQQAPDLFDGRAVKRQFHVDAYFLSLDAPAERLVAGSAYWYSMWSHRRNLAWKGYLQVDLAPAEDDSAVALLASLAAPGVLP